MHESPAARLQAALERSDHTAVARLLARRAGLLHDAGDASGGVVVGRDAVAESLIRLRDRTPQAAVLPAEVNGGPGAIIRTDQAVVGVLAFSIRRRRVAAVWATTAEEKLAGWQHRAG